MDAQFEEGRRLMAKHQAESELLEQVQRALDGRNK